MVNGYMGQLLDELRAEGTPDPLGARILVAAFWDDLCRLAGEVPPSHVRLVLEDLASGDLRPPDPDALPASDASLAQRPVDTSRPHAGGRYRPD